MIVSLEGIDGAGKRTLSQQLAALSIAHGLKVVQLSFPRYGRSVTSSAISALLATSANPSTPSARFAAALFACERLEALPILREAVGGGGLVLVDRYVDSNLAYQGARAPKDDRKELLRWIEVLEYETFDIPRPDFTILIDVEVATSMSRVRERPLQDGRPPSDEYERDHSLLSGARQIYLDLFNEGRAGSWTKVSTSDGIDASTIAERLWLDHILPMMSAHQGPSQ